MRSRILALSFGLITLCACDRKPDVVLQKTMTDVIAPQAQLVWDLANTAQDDDGKADGSKLTDADWAKIAEAGQKIKDQATALTQAARGRIRRLRHDFPRV